MIECPVCHSDQHGCFESVALDAAGKPMWICRKPADFGEQLADLVKVTERLRVKTGRE